MPTDNDLLNFIDEDILRKLDTDKHELHGKIADVCFRLRYLLRERQKADIDYKGPKRDRAAYFRGYRAKQKAKVTQPS